MEKAFSYLRVSGKGQVEGDGFPRQRESIQRYAQGCGVEVAQEFRDEGVSGTKDLEHRAGLADLLAAIEANGVRLVLVERADRLARDLMVGEIILGQFRSLGVKVVAADSGVDLTVADDDPTRTLIRQVLGAIAQFDKSVTVLKLRAARERQRRENGKCEGQKAYGQLPGEAEILERIQQLHRKPRDGKRLSVAGIAQVLNQEGIPARSGKPWKAGTVWTILNRKAG